MNKHELKLDWCSHEAAKYAVEHWHYSKTMPKSKLVKIGVWERGVFVGCVIFGVGGVPGMYKQVGVDDNEGCELVRIALRDHSATVTRIVSISIKMLKSICPKLRVVLSYADTKQGHIGAIYQAGNWLFSGYSQSSDEYIYQGKQWHGRAFRHRFKGMEHHASVRVVKGSQKIRYLMPLDNEIRERILKLSKPYPKRASSETNDTSGNLSEKGGATPTDALHSEGGDPCPP